MKITYRKKKQTRTSDNAPGTGKSSVRTSSRLGLFTFCFCIYTRLAKRALQPSLSSSPSFGHVPQTVVLFHHDHGYQHEHADPAGRGQEPLVDGRVRYRPVPGGQCPERLRGQRDGQHPADRPEYPVHALQRPDHAAEHGQREEAAQAHERGRRVRVAEHGHHEPFFGAKDDEKVSEIHTSL